MADNRRRYPRVRARGLAAHLRTAGGRTACQVENVSMGGLFVRTDRLEEVGTELQVDLVKPGWKKQLTLAARVSSRVETVDSHLKRRMPGLGLQFVKLDDKQHERLQGLLRELGAPEEDLEVTLPDETAEEELRALELDLSGPELEPLDPQPQPLWQQVQMTVEAAIEGTLREAGLPPPAPLALAPQAPRPPANPTPPQTAAPSDPASENARLRLQLRGLVMQLSDAQQQLAQRDAEIQKLHDELETTRADLRRALDRQ